MKLANIVRIRVFVKPEENEQEIKQALLKLLPFNLEEEKIVLERRAAQGFNERKIIVCEISLQKDRQINKFLEHLNQSITKSQKALLLKQADSRLDSELNFFIRLDKQSLLQGNYLVTDSGDCFHIRISVAAFPRTKEVAMKVVNEIFR